MININNILDANEVLAGVVKETPVLYSEEINKALGANLFLKAECNQINGSFKTRGAYFAMHQYFKENKKKDVVAFSSGNHAQGVAYSAKELGIKATIFMPKTTPLIKVNAVRDLKAKVVLVGNNFDDALKESKTFCKKNKVNFIHPFDDPLVIAGQGTTGLEIAQQVQYKGITNADVLVCCGGGGLISGIALALNELNQNLKARPVEPENFDDELEDALESLANVVSSTDLWIEDPLERGQLQFLNNLDLVHFRSHFNDHEDPACKRHLYRTWHRNSGERSYDG